jgi:hypothetical protein
MKKLTFLCLVDSDIAYSQTQDLALASGENVG